MVMKPSEVRRIIGQRLAAGELPAQDPERLAAELYLRNGLTQRAIGELLGWSIPNVNQWLSHWLDDMRRELVDWDTMRAHGGSEYYHVNPASWGRPDPQPPSLEQTQRAATIRLARLAQGLPRQRRKPRPIVRDERWRYAEELLAVWPG
jgi:hypothetical protein